MFFTHLICYIHTSKIENMIKDSASSKTPTKILFTLLIIAWLFPQTLLDCIVHPSPYSVDFWKQCIWFKHFENWSNFRFIATKQLSWCLSAAVSSHRSRNLWIYSILFLVWSHIMTAQKLPLKILLKIITGFFNYIAHCGPGCVYNMFFKTQTETGRLRI